MEALQQVGKYLFLEEQERSELSVGWRAVELVNARIDKYYLADVINPKLGANARFLEAYLNQSLLLEKLEHPNILKKIATSHETGDLISFAEYQEGFTLAKVLERCRSDGFPFSIDHALLVVSKLLSALSYAKTKHLPHGFVNPSVIFVTHEGEVKLKGFAMGAAFRALGGKLPNLGPKYSNYIPPGLTLVTGDHDGLDIYGCGAILYEMLTGETVGGGSAAQKVSHAVTASEGEKIPPRIANILVSALDSGAPTAYGDIQKMAKDMEELLYSGEYSPTTFNLAFFMHSAFRTEMEELGEKIAAEKERDFSGQGASSEAGPAADTPLPSPSQERQSVIMPDPEEAELPTGYSREQTKKKSKLPMILGAVALVAVAGVLAFLFWPKPEDGGQKFEEQRAKLEQEGEQAVVEALRRQQEELEKQNELYRQQLQQQAEADRERKKQELEAEMKRMDQEISRLKALEEQEQKTKELEDKLSDLEQQRLQAEEDDRLRQEAEKAALKYKEERASNVAGNEESQTDDAQDAGPEEEEVLEPLETADTTHGQENTAEQPVDTATAKKVEAQPKIGPVALDVSKKPEVTLVPPKRGEIVALDDPLLEYPVLMEAYETQEVPKKAIRDGVVERDRTISFFMKALVNEDGEVEEVELMRSPLPDNESDYGMISKALKAAKKVKFTSPTKMGVKVKVWMIFPIHFQGK